MLMGMVDHLARKCSAVLVFGPSGVGKTETINIAAKMARDYEFESLDVLVDKAARARGFRGLDQLRKSAGNDRFLQVGRELIAERQAQCVNRLVIDVGSGFLTAENSGIWLHEHSSIVIFASLEFTYERIQSRGFKGTLEQYRDGEFSLRRLAMYDQADHRLEIAGLSREQAGANLVSLLQNLATP
jgi:adenylate kinase